MTLELRRPLEVFFSYSHKDQRLRDQLEAHLKLLRKEGLISSWHDHKIGAGEEWKGQIDAHLNTAQIILLLVSSDFIASDYCYDIEMKRAMERHQLGEARIIPVILRPCDWQNAPFGKLQALPKDCKPVTTWPNRDEAFLDVAQGIRNVVNDLAATSYSTSILRSIIGMPPPTDPRTIQQREQAVIEVYEKLNQPDITAIVLTGMGGLGKSTLAALVYRYAEKERLAGRGLFESEAIWLKIDDAVTMTELGGTLLEALNKSMPEFGQLDPHNQALALFHALHTAEKSHLIVLDQFESLLDGRTGRALANRPGIAEWLDAMNSDKCHCRLLLTSRSRPQGTRVYPQTFLQEYPVQGMSLTEGRDLLRKQGVLEEQATEEDLRTAVECCEGHAMALTLLADILREYHLPLKTLLEDSDYEQLWIGDIATNLLDYIYQHQLDEPQRKLLRAFSVFREAVPLAAAGSVMDYSEMTRTHLSTVLRGLLAQHLLQATGEGYYQLHSIVCSYAQSHFEEDDVQANRLTLQATHARAAEYYLQQAKKSCPPREKRRDINDVHQLIEAVWHYCQAEQWQKAYDLMQREGLLSDIKLWGRNALLLELCLPLLPLDKWTAERHQEAEFYYYLGWIYCDLGEYKLSLKYYQEALLIYREIGDQGGESKALTGLGSSYHYQGIKEVEIPLFEEALKMSKAVGNRMVEGLSLNNLGYVYKGMGKHKEAQKYFEEALSIRKEIKDYDGESRTLNGLGSVYRVLGMEAEALECFRKALHLNREFVRNRYWESIILNSIGKFYFKLGHRDCYEISLACFVLARNILEELQSPARNTIQEKMNDIKEKVGEQHFASMLVRVEQQASQILEKALSEGLTSVQVTTVNTG